MGRHLGEITSPLPGAAHEPEPRITDWQGRRVWLIGAISGIAAPQQRHCTRVARRSSSRRTQPGTLAAFVAAHPGSQVLLLDVTAPPQVQAAAAQVLCRPLDLVCYCAGTYQDLRATGFDLAPCNSTPP